MGPIELDERDQGEEAESRAGARGAFGDLAHALELKVGIDAALPKRLRAAASSSRKYFIKSLRLKLVFQG